MPDEKRVSCRASERSLETVDHSIMDDSGQSVSTVLPGRKYLKRQVHPPVDDPEAQVLKAWAPGLMAGALVVMVAITYANMRPGSLLHKLILLEVKHPYCNALGQGCGL